MFFFLLINLWSFLLFSSHRVSVIEERDRNGKIVGEVVFAKLGNFDAIILYLRGERCFRTGFRVRGCYFRPGTRTVCTKVKPEEEIINAIVLFVRKQLLFSI